MKNLRHLRQQDRQLIDSEMVLTRIGQLGLRNINTLVRTLLTGTIGGTVTATIFEGFTASPGAGLSVDLAVPMAAVQDAGDGDETLLCAFNNSGSDVNVSISTADATNPRIDIICARMTSQTAFSDSSVSQVDPATRVVSATTFDRDTEYYLEFATTDGTAAASPSAPSIPAGTAGSITGTVLISGTINLSSEYILSIAVGEEGEFTEIDCRGAVPGATTLAEIINAINAVYTGLASNSSNYLKLTASNVGEYSVVRIKQPSDPTLDAFAEILGGTESLHYVNSYRGTNKWFKVCEVYVPALAASLSAANVRSIEEKDSDWNADADTIAISGSLNGIVGKPETGMIPRWNAAKYDPTLPAEFLSVQTIRSGKTVAVDDVVSYYGTTGTIEKNGKAYKQYAATEIDTTPTASNSAKPQILAIDATHFIALYSDDAAFTGITGAYCTLNTDRTVTVAAPVAIAATGSTNAAPFHACVLDSTHFVVMWMNAAGTTVTGVRCTIASSTFTVGAAQTTAFTATALRISTLSSSTFVMIELVPAGTCYVRVVSAPSDTFTFNAHVAFPSTYAAPVAHASDILVTDTDAAIAILHDSTDLVIYQITISGTVPTVVQAAKTASLTMTNSAYAAYRAMYSTISADGNTIFSLINQLNNGYYTLIGITTQTATDPTDRKQFISFYSYIDLLRPDDAAGLQGDLEFGDALIMPSDDLLYFATASVQKVVNAYWLVPLKIAMSTNTNTVSNRIGYSIISGLFDNLSTPRNITVVDANTATTLFHNSALQALDETTFIGLFLSNNGSTTSVMALPVERHTVLGICKEAGTGDGTITSRTQVGGIVTGLSGLIAGRKYYADDSGALSLETTNYEMGTALTASSLLLEKREII